MSKCNHKSSFPTTMNGNIYCSSCGEKLLDYLDMPFFRTKTWYDIKGRHTQIIEIRPIPTKSRSGKE